MSEYITENLVKQEKEKEAREKNGFIEEWSTKDKEENNEGKTRMLSKLRSALELASNLGSGK